MELINAYKNQLAKGPKTRGRKKLLDTKALLVSLIFLFCLPLCFGQEEAHMLNNVIVNYCSSISEKQPVLLSSVCNPDNFEIKANNIAVTKWIRKYDYYPQAKVSNELLKVINLEAYSKLEHSVIGKGFQCKVSYEEWVFSSGFFGGRSSSSKKVTPFFSALDCWKMIEEKRCLNIFTGKSNDMQCKTDSCQFQEEFDPKFEWYSDVTVRFYQCSFTPREIIADDEEHHVFGLPCLAKELFCKLRDSIVVWQKQFIKKCPFTRVLDTKQYTIIGNDEYF